MRLFELFNRTADWRWVNQTKAKFDVDGLLYQVNFHRLEGDEVWEAEFLAQHGQKTTDKVTGTGNQFLVFSTVAAVISEFVDRMKPKSLLVASLRNREKIYQNMLVRLANASGYKLGDKWYAPSNQVFFRLDKKASLSTVPSK